MARIRTIKPEFFRHVELYKSEIQTKLPLRVAFAGLWTACDREGRFKWKPEELKLDCLPYDNVDFSRVLDALWSCGFIEKYTSDNKIYGFVPSWSDHQHINNRETESILPNPYESEMLTCDSSVNDTTEKPLRGREGKGRGREGEKEYPSLEDVKNYFKEKGFNEQTAIKFYDSYSIANWVDSKGQRVLNWKQKAINVWFKDENKLNGHELLFKPLAR